MVVFRYSECVHTPFESSGLQSIVIELPIDHSMLSKLLSDCVFEVPANPEVTKRLHFFQYSFILWALEHFVHLMNHIENPCILDQCVTSFLPLWRFQVFDDCLFPAYSEIGPLAQALDVILTFDLEGQVSTVTCDRYPKVSCLITLMGLSGVVCLILAPLIIFVQFLSPWRPCNRYNWLFFKSRFLLVQDRLLLLVLFNERFFFDNKLWFVLLFHVNSGVNTLHAV